MGIGKVLWFNDAKGYGMIEDEHKNTLFVHYTQILMDGYKFLKEGDLVEFDTYHDVKGLTAKNVKKKH